MTRTIPASGTLAQAIARIHTIPRAHFIAGQFASDKVGERNELINPATEGALGSVPNGTAADVDHAVAAARAASPSWAARSAGSRAEVLNALAEVIDTNGDLLAAVESVNVGKPLPVAREEIPGASDSLRFMAGAARTAQTPAAGQYVAGHLSFVHREPVGVVGAVTPWNYPLMMAVWKLAPALAAGNTVVLKPSEQTPLSTLLLMELASEILPVGVVNIVLGTGAVVGEALSHHPGIDMISLTGSVRSGHLVAAGAASTLKRVHLELGGKAPVVIFDDADLDAAVETLAVAGYWNTGQECGAATRVLCHVNVKDALVQRLVAASEALTIGDPFEGDSVDLGPLISAAQRDRIAAMVQQACTDGATVATGGQIPSGPGFFYPPTVITDVGPGTNMAREEVFGPVISVETFTTEAEAVRRANDVDYGLSASVWTADQGRALRTLAQLNFGTVWVNSHLTLATEMPWGGFGKSGYGRDNATYALDDYSRTKHVMLAMGAPTEE